MSCSELGVRKESEWGVGEGILGIIRAKGCVAVRALLGWSHGLDCAEHPWGRADHWMLSVPPTKVEKPRESLRGNLEVPRTW